MFLIFNTTAFGRVSVEELSRTVVFIQKDSARDSTYGTGFLIGKEPIPLQPRWLGKMDLKGQFTKLVQIGPELGWAATLSP